MGIGCFREGCKNTVIGQCRGYKSECGRFYCKVHRSGILCGECVYAKELEEKYADYVAAAENVAEKSGIAVYVFAVIFVLLTVGAVAVSINHAPTIYHALLICAVPAVCAALIMWGITYKNRYAESSLASAERGRPGFREFYKKYWELREQAQLERSLASQRELLYGMLGAVIGGAIAGSAKGISDMAGRIAEDTAPRVTGEEEELRKIRKILGG